MSVFHLNINYETGFEDTIAIEAEDFVAAKQECREVWKRHTPAERSAWESLELVEVELDYSEVIYNRSASAADIAPAYYGVNGKRYVVESPVDGKWAGFVFIKTGSEYHDRSRVATILPGGGFSRNTTENGQRVAMAIATDPMARMAEYGTITGSCVICNRTLEDPESVRRGIGPVCFSRIGG